jgi:hypothetical protein
MSDTPPASNEDSVETHARHGYRNEVNWEGGSGRQPYGNQGRSGQAESGGRRGAGRRQPPRALGPQPSSSSEQVKRKP